MRKLEMNFKSIDSHSMFKALNVVLNTDHLSIKKEIKLIITIEYIQQAINLTINQ